tara:strand:- start:5162 stop:6787 length:1626 start_codon:yes stop_codon:yes gene_type:complete
MVLDTHSYLLGVFAGLAFFMYGLDFVSSCLKEIMGNRVRDLLAKLSKSKPLSISVGILLTLLMQSSGAVTSLLVALGKARVTTLSQVMGVIIGSAIGSTITVQLISFNIAQIGLPVFTVAFFAYFLAQKPIMKSITGILMGFGLVFFGLELMGIGAAKVKDVEWLSTMFIYLNENHIIAMVVSAVVTAMVHSSAVTVGLAMTLAASDVITAYDAIFWVFGANIGTTSTALMTAIGGNAIGRQVAWANVLFKAGTLCVVYFFASQLHDLVAWMGGAVPRQIANAHTLFNFFGAVLFYPFIELGARLLQQQIQPSKSEQEFGPKYLDKSTVLSPIIALSEAKREVSRMSDIVHYMIVDSLKAFEDEDTELVKTINESDNRVDLLQREIKDYLIEMATDSDLAEQVRYTFSYVSDLETAADIVDRGLLELSRKKHNLKLQFSSEGWGEICELQLEVRHLADLSASCFQLHDANLAEQVIEQKKKISKMENRLRSSHFERLNQGLKESLNTSSIHLDVLADYRRIASVLSNHAYEVRKQRKKRKK